MSTTRKAMIARRTTAFRRFGTVTAAMIVAAAGLLLGAAPASADGYTHYENVGNPGWCLDGDGTDAYLHRCGAGDVDFQLWYYTHGSDNLELVHVASGKCLTAVTSFDVGLRPCDGRWGSRWDARGKNGWVKLVNRATGGCLQPSGTGVGGSTRYPLTMASGCGLGTDNVPNIIAWRYFA